MPTPVRNRFLELLARGRPLLADGAMGTTLFTAGLESGDAPERWNLDRPDRVVEVHRNFLEAGSEVILTNSFGGNAFRLRLHALHDRVLEINRTAADLAHTAAGGVDRTVLVAGSMGPTGELLAPMGSMRPEACRDAFAEQAAGLVEGGVDVLWLETMSDLGEVEAAVAGIGEVTDVPVAVCMSFDTAGRTMMGVTAAEMADRLASLGVAAIGANCGNNLADTEEAVRALVASGTGLPVISKANAGIPEWSEDGLVYSGSPPVMGAHAKRVAQAGASIIGGCCGSGAEHLRLMRDVLDGTVAVPDVAPPNQAAPTPAAPRTRLRRRTRG